MNCSEDEFPKSKKEAKSLGAKYYFTGKPCKYGHISKRLVCNSMCYSCHRNYGDNHYWRNHEKQLDRRKRWRKENPDYFKEWKSKYPSYMSDYCKNWRKKNPLYPKLYYESNKSSIISYVSQRRAMKLRRVIGDYKGEIHDIYKECARLSESTGITYHVDHIVPLNGDNVCGLHVPWNLQIITAEENLKKGNKLEMIGEYK